MKGPGTSFDLPVPYADYGGYYTLRNLFIKGMSTPGTRGIIIQRRSRLENVGVRDFGWHGFHVTAGLHRTTDGIDGGISKANGTTLIDREASKCGHEPGEHPDLASPEIDVNGVNPGGRRSYGSGLRLEGTDANICVTRQFRAKHCAGWAIDDLGYLGNTHILPSS